MRFVEDSPTPFKKKISKDSIFEQAPLLKVIRDRLQISLLVSSEHNRIKFYSPWTH